MFNIFFFFSSRRRHTRWPRDWSSDVCSSDLNILYCNVLINDTVNIFILHGINNWGINNISIINNVKWYCYNTNNSQSFKNGGINDEKFKRIKRKSLVDFKK